MPPVGIILRLYHDIIQPMTGVCKCPRRAARRRNRGRVASLILRPHQPDGGLTPPSSRSRSAHTKNAAGKPAAYNQLEMQSAERRSQRAVVVLVAVAVAHAARVAHAMVAEAVRAHVEFVP